MTDLREILPNMPSHSGYPKLAILAGYVSMEQPAPSSFADQLYVTVPGHGAEVVYLPPTWPIGPSLPVAGDPVVLGVDDNGTAQCLAWSPATRPAGATTRTGEISLYAGPTPPAGSLLCDGSPYSPTDFPALNAIIGDTYGGTAIAPLLPDSEAAPWASAIYVIWI